MASGKKLLVLIEEIHREHSAAIGAAKRAIEHCLECGRLLTEAKVIIPHGNWEQWVHRRCEFGPRQARKYMRLWKERDQIGIRNADFDSIEAALVVVAQPEEHCPKTLPAFPEVGPTEDERYSEKLDAEDERFANGDLNEAQKALLFRSMTPDEKILFQQQLAAGNKLVDTGATPEEVETECDRISQEWKAKPECERAAIVAKERTMALRRMVTSLEAFVSDEPKMIASEDWSEAATKIKAILQQIECMLSN